ncbi:MAG: DedA family protein [Lentisphaerota bacterium]
MTEILIRHIEFAATHAHVWGFVIIFVLMAIESSFIPLPSEVIMIPAGFLAFRCGLTFQSPHLDAIVAVLMGAFGSLAGAMFNYYLSLWLGRPILYKYGKYFFLKPQFLERSEEIFRQYGDITTFVCRFLPAIRHLISIPAGLSRMDLKRFSFYTTLGAGIWCIILTYIGYYLGHVAGNMSYADLVHKGKNLLSEHFIWIIVGLVIAVVVYLYIHHKVMKGSKK